AGHWRTGGQTSFPSGVDDAKAGRELEVAARSTTAANETQSRSTTCCHLPCRSSGGGTGCLKRSTIYSARPLAGISLQTNFTLPSCWKKRWDGWNMQRTVNCLRSSPVIAVLAKRPPYVD